MEALALPRSHGNQPLSPRSPRMPNLANYDSPKCSFCALAAVKYCGTCKLFSCADHLREHTENRFTANHVTINPKDMVQECDVHSSSYTAYCQKCSKLICQLCTSTEHKSHGSLSIKDASEKQREKINSMCEMLSGQSQYILKTMSTNRMQVNDKKREIEKLQREIDKCNSDIEKLKVQTTEIDLILDSVQRVAKEGSDFDLLDDTKFEKIVTLVQSHIFYDPASEAAKSANNSATHLNVSSLTSAHSSSSLNANNQPPLSPTSSRTDVSNSASNNNASLISKVSSQTNLSANAEREASLLNWDVSKSKQGLAIMNMPHGSSVSWKNVSPEVGGCVLTKDPLNTTMSNFWELEILELESRMIDASYGIIKRGADVNKWHPYGFDNKGMGWGSKGLYYSFNSSAVVDKERPSNQPTEKVIFKVGDKIGCLLLKGVLSFYYNQQLVGQHPVKIDMTEYIFPAVVCTGGNFKIIIGKIRHDITVQHRTIQ